MSLSFVKFLNTLVLAFALKKGQDRANSCTNKILKVPVVIYIDIVRGILHFFFYLKLFREAVDVDCKLINTMKSLEGFKISRSQNKNTLYS